MTPFIRLTQGVAIAVLVALTSGCIIAPDHEREHEHDRHEHRDRQCGEHDDHCRDR
ncbi:MAG: hypothetical protein M3O06_07275 [Pseudomonadota bacterium]|nr:hypothetical protein [Pseudomonadota bacterium]